MEFSVSTVFEHDYQILELDRDATWHDVRESYRRLVNRWHPDRYASRPREKQHAQTRFIEVTKAYNNLRAFYRKHQRLPLQNPALQDATTANIHASQVSKRTAKHKVHNVDELIFEPSSNVVKNPHFKYWMLAIPAVGLFVTIAMHAPPLIEKSRIRKTLTDASARLYRIKPPQRFAAV